MTIDILLERFDPHAALAAFAEGNVRGGALASFVGYCRGEAQGGDVAWLDLEHYPGFTEAEIARLAMQARARFALIDLLVLHRAGRILPGEAIVLVAALSPHRAEAFAAVEHLMDYLKTDAPFWKREQRGDGAYWIEPTADDRRRRLQHESAKHD